MHNSSRRPTIVIDLKKNRIRIFRQTIRAIGNPKYILLLVNPENRTIIILCSTQDDRRALRLSQAQFAGKQSFELHSKALMQNLRSISADWTDGYSYRICGSVLKERAAVRFRISEALPTGDIRRIIQ